MAPSRDRVTVVREAGRLLVSMRGERSLGAVYPLAQVRNLRAEAAARRQGSIAFEVDGRTVRFGARLDPADAERVLAALGTRVALGPSRLPPEPPAPEPEPWEPGGG